MNRRSFLRTSAVAIAGVAAMAAALEPLRDLNDYTSMEKFFQKPPEWIRMSLVQPNQDVVYLEDF